MSSFSDDSSQNLNGAGGEHKEGTSNIFLDMSETDSTGIPSLKQAPVSAISASAPESKINTQLVIALCVMAIGGGAIYGMRYIGMQAGLDENIVSIDYTSETNSADFSDRFSSVSKILDESTISVQFASTDDFAPMPFARPSTVQEEVEPIDPGMSQEERLALQKQRELELEIQRRREMVIGEVMRFKLQGIVGEAARISGQPVREGMSLGEYCTVIEITGRTVTIEADGMYFELALGQETVQLDR